MVTSAVAWTVGFLIFFPILWTILTSFKTELEAFSIPPKFLFFDWTLENYELVQERSNYLRFAMNSVILSLGATLVSLLFAIPAAWAMAFAPGKRTKDLLMWMLSTKMMPPVGALIPIYLIFRDFGLLDYARRPDRGALPSRPADRGVDALHLFQGDPRRDSRSGAHGRRLAVEGTRLCSRPHGGAGHCLDPAAELHPGLERSRSGRSISRPPMPHRSPQFIASYSSPEGLFWAKLSAASTMAIAPILVLGWFAQKQLVRGLTFGAVK